MNPQQPAIDLREGRELFLIGGVPRAGKSKLAKSLWTQQHIPSFAIDVIVASYFYLAPESGIGWAETPERSDKMILNTRLVATAGLRAFGTYAIEGESLAPSIAHSIRSEFNVHACFLVLRKPRIEDVIEHEGEDSWVKDVKVEQYPQLVAQLTERSEWIINQAEYFDFPWIDMTSGKYQDRMDEAAAAIVTKTTSARHR